MTNIAIVIDLEWPLKRHHEVLAGIQAYAAEHHPSDWDLMLDHFPDLVLSGEIPGPDFHAVIGRLAPRIYNAALAAGIPAVNTWMQAFAGTPTMPSVLPDMAAAARLAVDHLAARGLRRFAHVGVRNDYASKVQAEAMGIAAASYGFPCSTHLCRRSVEGDPRHWLEFCRELDRWLAQWRSPIGILCNDDGYSRSISKLSQRSGWMIPEHMAILGTGNDSLICEASVPQLSSIDMGYFRNGYEAARLLDRLLRGETAPTKPLFVPPAELVLRRSTDVFAVGDADVAAALRFMAENCDKTLPVDGIAATVKVGRRTLERRFQETLGRSILDELNRLRVERMKRLLVETDHPIKLIFREAGFGTSEQMRTTFRKFTGTTATAYRQQHR